MRDNGDEMSEIGRVLPLIGGEDVGVEFKYMKIKTVEDLGPDDRLFIHEKALEEIEDMEIADANLVWWIQLAGTLLFAGGVTCLLVAHILGKP